MITRLLIAGFLLPIVACGGNSSKKSNAPLQAVENEESKVLGEEDDEKSKELGSDDANPESPAGPDEAVSDPKDKAKEVAESVDLSKAAELIYSFKNGNDIKEVAIQFADTGCSIASSVGKISGSALECAAIKAAILSIGSVPGKSGEIPVIPEGSSELLTEALKRLPI